MFQNLLKRFAKSDDGAVMPLIGISILVLVGVMGFAIDLGRAQLVHAKLLNSADAAGLAVGARLSTIKDLNAEAKKFVDANFPVGYANATVTSVTAVANAANSIVTVNASATMQTSLMQIFGIKTVALKVTSQITRQTSGLELALVLDNTGSMVSPDATKLPALKTAAKDLVNILYGSNATVPNLYVGLVPFSHTVNIGSSRTAWMKPNSISSHNWSSSSWAGCVMARTGGEDVKDTFPSTDALKFAPYFWDHSDSLNKWRKYENDSYYDTIDANGVSQKGPNAYCPTAITPMAAAKSTVVTAIDAMKEGGATHVNYGAVWGWRLLSPKWRDKWGGDMNTNHLPLDYNTPKMNKAVVIMTDGDNDYSPYAYTAYGYLSAGTLGTTNKDAAEKVLDTRLQTICTSMKAQNIIVYTVVFGTGVTSTIKTLMQTCATKPDFYFDSPTNESLKIAFQAIGDSLSNLRVSN